MSKSAVTTRTGRPPRSVSEIEEQLKEVTEALKSAEASDRADFASRMGVKSLRGLRAELQQELDAAKIVESKANGATAKSERDKGTP